MADAFLDATAQAELVRGGEASPAELVEDAIDRIERLDPELNAVIVRRFEQARAEAAATARTVARPSGPFAGVPYLLKDIGPVSAGDRHAAGIAGVKAADYRPAYDSFFVRRMRAAGFILLGKTNLPELGLSTTTEPLAWGPTRNPWETSRSPAGSSGGSASAVAAGMVPVAHANDGAGSTRSPASHCGLVGLKPSRGRVSSGTSVTLAFQGLAVDLCVTRTVRDTAAILDVVRGNQPGDPWIAPTPNGPYANEIGKRPDSLRIGLLDGDPSGQGALDPDCVTAVRSAAGVLEGLGHDVREGFPVALQHDPRERMLPSLAVLTRANLDHYGELIGRPLTERDVEPETWALAEFGSTVSGTDYLAGVDLLQAMARDLQRWWEDEHWDLLLTPTLPHVPQPLGHPRDDPTTFTLPFNISGQPAISLPLHQSADGLPVGVQLVAAYGREDILLRVAAQLETAMPWHQRRPPTCR